MKEESKKSGKSGAGTGILSGRALFKYDPTLFQDDEAAADAQIYEEREEDEQDQEEKKEDGVIEESDNLRDGQSDNGEEGEDGEHRGGAGVDEELFKDGAGGAGEDEEEPDFD